MSLMAAAKHRDVYRAAIAVCPVTSWEHYDTAYTERYLGLPQDQPEAYECVSPHHAITSALSLSANHSVHLL